MAVNGCEGGDPLFSIVVVTYNRAKYVAEFLQSLAAQTGDVAHELVLLDNGSPREVFDDVSTRVAALACPSTILRHEDNLLAPSRWAEAVAAASGQFVLLPGDDDVVLPHYLETLRTLVSANPSASIVTGTSRHIDAEGRRLGSRSVPAAFTDQPTAYAEALVRPPYPMPSSGFRRDLVDVGSAPSTRTAFDWWLWLQALKGGPVARTEQEILLYRHHDGREADHYTNALNRVDAARMLAAEATSDALRAMLHSWSEAEVTAFATSLISGPGPMYGDPVWGALVQLLIADGLSQAGWVEPALALHAEAAAHAGAPMPVGHLQTFAGARALVSLPRETWRRSPITAAWTTDCVHLAGWRTYLDFGEGIPDGMKLFFACQCAETPSSARPFAQFDDGMGGQTTMELDWPVTERSAMALLGVIGGRNQPYVEEGIPVDIERALIERFRRFRRSRPGSIAESTYHWLLRRPEA